jgi:hypothetical protein
MSAGAPNNPASLNNDGQQSVFLHFLLPIKHSCGSAVGIATGYGLNVRKAEFESR